MPFDINFSAVGEEFAKDVEFIQKNIKRKKVVIFGKNWQTDTRCVKYVFDQLKQKYLMVEIDKNENEVRVERVFYKSTGGHTLLPYVFVNGQYIGSRNEVMEMDNSDELKTLLAEPEKVSASN